MKRLIRRGQYGPQVHHGRLTREERLKREMRNVRRRRGWVFVETADGGHMSKIGVDRNTFPNHRKGVEFLAVLFVPAVEQPSMDDMLKLAKRMLRQK